MWPQGESLITILFISTDFSNLPEDLLYKEVKTIEEELNKQAEKRDNIKFIHIWNIDANRLLREISTKKPSIIHFSSSDHEKGVNIFLDSDTQDKDILDPKGFSNICKEYGVEAVILNVAHSSKQAKIIAEGVPYVIGMKGDISRKALVRFAHGLYMTLGSGYGLEGAFKSGKSAIMLHRLKGAKIPFFLNNEKTMSQPSTTMPKTNSTSVDRELEEINALKSALNENDDLIRSLSNSYSSRHQTIIEYLDNSGENLYRSIGKRVLISYDDSNRKKFSRQVRRMFDFVKACLLMEHLEPLDDLEFILTFKQDDYIKAFHLIEERLLTKTSNEASKRFLKRIISKLIEELPIMRA